MEQSILEHAAVAVTVELEVSGTSFLKDNLGATHERTNRSRFNHLGFFGLNFMNLLKRT